MAHKASDLLVIDREEAAILLKAFNEWWIPRIATDSHEKIMEYDKLAKTLRYFLEEEQT